ncbi:polysaccharide deacetylase family protein [Carboxylicivirga taeanensis]|uniref:polysaccharide deacetylase family protein n=1 Tax=Carboxylicivirga taeanensis TaxID=1416875 RepID=UPI003F6DEAAF
MKSYKSIIRRLLTIMAGLLPFKLLRRWAAAELVCVNYHSIKGWEGDALLQKQPYRTLEAFEADIAFLKNNFQLVSMDRLVQWKKQGRPLPENSVFITIDDGLKVVHDLMWPVLKKYGVTPALFINPAFVNNEDLHYKRKRDLLLAKCRSDVTKSSLEEKFPCYLNQTVNYKDKLDAITYNDRILLDQLAEKAAISFSAYLAAQPVYLNQEELQALQNEGWLIGAHSMDHPPYSELHVEGQVQQTLDSLRYVQEHFGGPYRLMAYPSNDSHLRVALFDQTAAACDLSFGVQGLKQDVIPNHIHRIALEDTACSAKAALKAEYLKLIIQKLFKKAVHQREA